MNANSTPMDSMARRDFPVEPFDSNTLEFLSNCKDEEFGMVIIAEGGGKIFLAAGPRYLEIKSGEEAGNFVTNRYDRIMRLALDEAQSSALFPQLVAHSEETRHGVCRMQYKDQQVQLIDDGGNTQELPEGIFAQATYKVVAELLRRQIEGKT